MIRDVRAAYERFEFYRVYQRIYQFCAVELSSFYLDVLKDRLYAEAPESPDRRAAQFVLARLHDHSDAAAGPDHPAYGRGIVGLPARHSAKAAPAFIWRSSPRPTPAGTTASATPAGTSCSNSANGCLIALEGLQEEQTDRQAQEAKVRIATSRPEHWLPIGELLATLCIVSEVEIVADPAAAVESITAEPSLHTPNASGAGTIGPLSAGTPLHPHFASGVRVWSTP